MAVRRFNKDILLHKLPSLAPRLKFGNVWNVLQWSPNDPYTLISMIMSVSQGPFYLEESNVDQMQYDSFQRYAITDEIEYSARQCLDEETTLL